MCSRFTLWKKTSKLPQIWRQKCNCCVLCLLFHTWQTSGKYYFRKKLYYVTYACIFCITLKYVIPHGSFNVSNPELSILCGNTLAVVCHFFCFFCVNCLYLYLFAMYMLLRRKKKYIQGGPIKLSNTELSFIIKSYFYEVSIKLDLSYS